MEKEQKTNSIFSSKNENGNENETEKKTMNEISAKLRVFKVSRKREKNQEKIVEKKYYKCPYCNKEYINITRYEVHMRTHTGEKPFICQHCGKSFNEKGNLKTHLRVHTGERPFICKYKNCLKSFKTRGQLQDHENLHLDIKPFNCPFCQASFNRKSRLKIHKLIHLGVKPFSCGFENCGKKFREKSNLILHLKFHGIDISKDHKVYLSKYIIEDQNFKNLNKYLLKNINKEIVNKNDLFIKEIKDIKIQGNISTNTTSLKENNSFEDSTISQKISEKSNLKFNLFKNEENSQPLQDKDCVAIEIKETQQQQQNLSEIQQVEPLEKLNYNTSSPLINNNDNNFISYFGSSIYNYVGKGGNVNYISNQSSFHTMGQNNSFYVSSSPSNSEENIYYQNENGLQHFHFQGNQIAPFHEEGFLGNNENSNYYEDGNGVIDNQLYDFNSNENNLFIYKGF